MIIEQIINNKTLNAKGKAEALTAFILNNQINLEDLIMFATPVKDPVKAICIEAMEFATKQKPTVADLKTFEFVVQELKANAASVKWESAKVVGNIVHLFTTKLDIAIKNLLDNTRDEGTVVRWSAAYALGEIVKLKTKHNKALLPKIETIIAVEEKSSIKKIYRCAIKTMMK